MEKRHPSAKTVRPSRALAFALATSALAVPAHAAAASPVAGMSAPLASVVAVSSCQLPDTAPPVSAVAFDSGAGLSKAALINGGQPSALEALVAAQGAQVAAAASQPITIGQGNSAALAPATGSLRARFCVDRSAYGSPLAHQPVRRATSLDFRDVFSFAGLQVSRTPFDQNWRRVAARPQAPAQRAAETVLATSGHDRALTRDLVQRVNSYVNTAVRYVPDSTGYGRSDFWASASETLNRGLGDCEDFAIAKMQVLRAAGFSEDDLQLVIVRDLVRRADHAILVVRVDDALLLLDNNTDVITDASRMQDYMPVFSYSAGRKWVHGRRLAQANTAPPVLAAR